MSYERTALKAAQGIDTQDLLDHIAWTDVLRPQLTRIKDILTQKLVDSTLRPTKPDEESREMIAGKLWGIDCFIRVLEGILKAGGDAKAALAAMNLYLQ